MYSVNYEIIIVMCASCNTFVAADRYYHI